MLRTSTLFTEIDTNLHQSVIQRSIGNGARQHTIIQCTFLSGYHKDYAYSFEKHSAIHWHHASYKFSDQWTLKRSPSELQSYKAVLSNIVNDLLSAKSVAFPQVSLNNSRLYDVIYRQELYPYRFSSISFINEVSHVSNVIENITKWDFVCMFLRVKILKTMFLLLYSRRPTLLET